MTVRAEQPRTLGEIAARIGAELHGDASRRIDAVAPLDRAVEGALSFLSDRRYLPQLTATRAGAVIVRQEQLADCPVPALVCADPYAGYARAAQLLFPAPAAVAGIHPTAVVAADAVLADGVEIAAQAVVGAGCVLEAGVIVGPGSVLGPGVVVGAGSRLVAHVTLCHGVRIGARALIHPGAVIGADGFGFAHDASGWVKIPQLGTVRVGDDVEIGANTTIDRGALDDTVIGDGVILDNQIMIAHNVRIGARTAMAGCSAVAGSTTIGERCTIGGAVGIVGHLEICDDVHITACSFVAGSIREPGSYSSGMPLQQTSVWRRNAVRLKDLDGMARRIARLGPKPNDH